MKIAIDYTPAVRQIAGVGRYTRSLVQALIHTAPSDSYTLLYAEAAPSSLRDSFTPDVAPGAAGTVALRRLPVPERLLTVLWHRWRVPLWADLCAPGSAVFYSPNFVLPPLLRARGIVTIHDLSFLRYPETHDPGLVAFLTAAVPRAVRAAALVLADSEHTRQDTMALLGVPAEKTAVLLSAADPIFRPVDDPAALGAMRRRRSLDRPYILSVGTVQPRKNLPRLIAAVRLLREQTGEDILLVHAGRRGWLYAEVEQAVLEPCDGRLVPANRGRRRQRATSAVRRGGRIGLPLALRGLWPTLCRSDGLSLPRRGLGGVIRTGSGRRRRAIGGANRHRSLSRGAIPLSRRLGATRYAHRARNGTSSAVHLGAQCRQAPPPPPRGRGQLAPGLQQAPVRVNVMLRRPDAAGLDIGDLYRHPRMVRLV